MRIPDLFASFRRASRRARREIFARSGLQMLAILLVVGIGTANVVLFFTATPRPQAHAASGSFSETFATTTYRDAANTTGTWLGNGAAYMGPGSASSTRLYLESPPAGIKGFSAVSCKDADTCYLTTQTNAGITILRSTDAGTSWQEVYGGDLSVGDLSGNAQLNDIYAVPGTDVVYAVGKNSSNTARVLKSSDGGTTWAYMETGFSGSVYLKSISCSDSSTCVAVGDNLADVPKLYMTSNGGTTWAAGTVPAGGHALRGVNFINDGTSSTWRAVGVGGWMIASMATSTPQGWTAEAADTAEELRGVAMPVYGTVIIVGGTAQGTSYVAQSTDDGITYTEIVDALSSYLWDVVCGDADTCWGASYHGIERTDDAGATWTSVTGNVWYLFSATAVSGSVAYVAGNGNTTYTLMKTSTSSNFTDININPLTGAPPYPGYYSSPYFPITGMWQDPTDGQTLYGVGDTGSTGYVAKSTDAGLTWAFAASSNPGRVSAIDCATSQVCFAAGSGGALFKTTNGATSWTTQTQTGVFAANSTAVDAVTSQMAWVVGPGGSDARARIVRTIDGGTTYTAATGTISSLFWAEDVWADSTTTAWVTGYDTGTGKENVYYTADGGASWTQQYNVTAGLIYDIFFLPGNNTGWALDSAGAVLKTTNAGGTWTAAAALGSGPIGQYSESYFLNANVGFITGDGCSGSGDKFLTTIDGGTHWTLRNFPCTKGPISFYGNSGVVGGGYAVAQFGRIVFPYASSSVLQSTTVDSTAANISCAGITRTQTLNGGAVTYEMSNDGGATWTSAGSTCTDDAGHTVTADVHFVFASTGSDLRWRATLTPSGGSPPASPSIDALSVTYISNSLPATPTNSTPADAAVNQSLTPTLTASAFSDADGDDTQDSARWEVTTTSGNYTSPVYAATSTVDLTSIAIPSGTLANATTYYWHVRYADFSGGYSAFSTQTSFTTSNLPAAPSNLAPSNGATGASLTPTLTSSAFSDADAGDTHASSRWEVSNVAGVFTVPIYAVTSSLNLTSLVIPSGVLANNTIYYWHVKHVDASGNNSAYSTATSFTTLSSGGSSQSSIAKSSVPNSPVAEGDKTERGAKKILWKFQDMSGTELGFSIVDAKDPTKEYATSKPTFTQDLSELLETGATPATEHCNRAVVAFNDKGNSAITAASIYPCIWTIPDTPGELHVATSTQTTILINGIAPDDNPNAVTYSICEVKTKLCLARGAVAALAITAAIPTPTDNPAVADFALSKTGDKLTKAEWGASIAVAGLMPNTPYAFVATAYSPNGESASGQVASGGGGTQQASVQFTIDKSVAIYPLQPAQAALAGIGFAADFSFGILALLAIAGVVAYLLLHRKSGSIRCVAGLTRILQHHTASYMAVVGDGVGGPALTRHARIHRFTQASLVSALGALVLKGAILGAVLLGPAVALGQGDFSGDGLPVQAGDTMFYQISLKNIGPGDATAVVMTDALPQGTLFKAGTITMDGKPQTDACDNDNVCVSKNVLTLKRAAGLKVDEATIVTVAVKVFGTAGQIITNTACVTSQELPTPTCAAKTANPIVAAKPPIEKPANENLNANANVNANVNAPPVTPEKVTPPVNSNAPAPTNLNQNRNANVNENANANVNAPAPPPPQPGESQITIDGLSPSPERPTNDATPEIAGRGTPGALITISVDGTLVGVAFAEADGTWRFRLRDALPEGTHLVAASDAGKLLDTATFVTDTVAPPTIANLGVLLLKTSVSIRSQILPGENRGQDTTLVISGRTDPGTALVRLRIQSDPIEVAFAPPAQDWTREVTARFDSGEHTVTAVAFDAAGNSSPSVTKTFTIPAPEALAAPLAVLDNPQVEAAATVVAPAVVAAAAANVALATGIPALLNFLGLLFTQPALLFARREKKGYGVVFNSLSKLPVDLAIVRVRPQDSQRILQTKVTDRLGRYALFLAPGAFAVEVTKQGYTHPTKYLAGKTEDVAYTDLLATPAIALTEPARIAKNIPLDPLEDTKTPAAILRKTFLRRLQYAFALAGPIVSVIALLITPTLLVLGLTVLQFLAFALFRRLAYKKPPKSWGIVRDEQTGKPVPNAIVRIFETTYNKLLETQITDVRGRYAFLVGQNRYYVVASAPGYAETRTIPLDFTAAEKGAVVAKDVTLKR